MRTVYPLISLTLFTLGFGSGCASTFVVKSDPLGSDVSFIDPKSGTQKSLGKTPLEMKTSAVKEAVGEAIASGEYFTVVISQKGYVTEKVSVPATRFGTLVTQLDVKMKKGENEKEARIAKDILDQLFLAQRYAQTKEYDRAQATLDRIINDFPEFPRALSLRASIYFMQKNLEESLKWYGKALVADPQMEDAVRMTAKIKELQGNRSPASTGKVK